MSCLEVFLGGMASGTGRRSSQLASHLAVTPRRICLPRLATYLPQDDHRLGSLSLPRHPIRHSGHDVVQEYQPVGHRLPVSASAEVPTDPEQTHFTHERVDNRWTVFSPLSRLSCRHFHFRLLHDRLSPPLHWHR